MKIFRILLLITLLISSIFFACRTYELEKLKIDFKSDLIELSKIKYGLFNVDEWKLILADIIGKKIEEFNLDETNREEMRIKISNFLTMAINKFEERYYDKNLRSFLGIFRATVALATKTFDRIKEDIPVFTEQILNFLNDKENRESIREYLVRELNEYADETFSETDYSLTSSIINTHDKQNIESTKNYLNDSIKDLDSKNWSNKLALISIILFCSFFLIFIKDFTKSELVLIISICFIFLLMGILLPMIEIDARISEMNFTILGEKIGFTDQVLYFKSKSILEVVQLMILQKRVDLVAVGILVLLFSVIFPISKLIFSIIHLQNPKSQSNPFISFMVLKSGKWSMADVMVIAIFMAYIGFDGIISEQLKQLENLSPNLDVLTTNQSNLLFGFYMFTFFVLLSLLASQKIQTTTNSQ